MGPEVIHRGDERIQRVLPVALAALVALGAFAGTISAYTPLTARPIADILLALSWVTVGSRWLIRRRRPDLASALVLTGVLIAVTLLAVPFADPLSRGLESVRLSVWPLSAIVLIALAPGLETRRNQIVRVALLITGLALAYSALRHLTGPSQLEEEIARAALPGVRDQLQLRFFGSLPTAQQLAILAATTLPISLSSLLSSTGRSRLLYGVVASLAIFVVIASEVRTGTIAALAGALVVSGLFAGAGAFPREHRRRAAVIALTGVLVVGAASYLAVVANDADRADRFAGILDPASDESFSARLDRWEDAIPEIADRPLGAGLGTSGVLAAEQPSRAVAAPNLDNDYLKIGIEQGPAPMLLSITVLAALGLALAGLARRGEITVAPLAAGACGALAALAVMASTGFSLEQLQALPVWIVVGLALARASVGANR